MNKGVLLNEKLNENSCPRSYSIPYRLCHLHISTTLYADIPCLSAYNMIFYMQIIGGLYARI